jgi:hypothetical protein
VFSLCLSLSLSSFSERGEWAGEWEEFWFRSLLLFLAVLWVLGVLDPDCDLGGFFCWWWYYSEVSDLVVRRRAAAAADGEGKDGSLCKPFPLRLQRE